MKKTGRREVKFFCSLSFLSSKIKCFCCWSLFFQCCERACIVEKQNLKPSALLTLSLFVVFTLPWLLLGREHIQPQHVICTNAPSLVPCPFSQQQKKSFFPFALLFQRDLCVTCFDLPSFLFFSVHITLGMSYPAAFFSCFHANAWNSLPRKYLYYGLKKKKIEGYCARILSDEQNSITF